MASIIQRTKRIAATQTLNQIAKLFGRCTDEQIVKIWRLFEKVASDPNDRKELRRMRWLAETHHPFTHWLKRISSELAPEVRKRFIQNVYGNAWFLAKSGPRAEFEKKHGFPPPNFIVIDVTARCNLRCDGCWAAKYSKTPDIPMEKLFEILDECRDQMGIHYITLSGGEPFMRKDLFTLFEKYRDVQFLIYTNGMMIDEEMATRLAKVGNAMPMVSIEGFEEATDRRRGKGAFQKILDVMERLHRHGVLVGYSATATRHNWDEISSEAFVKLMLEKGCFYGWYFQYIPVGRDPDPSIMVTPEQRDQLRRRIYKWRNTHPIFLADFWNDGPEVGGCMAGGKRYLHINNLGDIEPCVFAHFAVDNIRDKTLTEALKSPFFTAIRNGIPYDGNTLRACMIVDRPEVLRQYCAKYGARPTHEGGESLLTTLAPQMDENARGVAEIYDKAWAMGDWMRAFPDPPPDYQ